MRTRRIALFSALGLALCLLAIALINTRAQSRQNAELVRLTLTASQQYLASTPTASATQHMDQVAPQVLLEAEKRTLAGEFSENIQMALVAFAAFALFVAVLLWLQRRWVARSLAPLHRLIEDMRAFEDGDLERRTPSLSLRELDALAKGFNHLAESLQASIEAQQALSRQSLDLRREERTRMARDLHDDLGQTLTVAAIEIAAARARDSTDHRLDAIESSLETARQRLRALLGSLRDIEPQERLLSWDQLIQPWLQRHPDVRWHLADGLAGRFDALRAQEAVVLQRVIEEALVNAFRHARPTTCALELTLPDEIANLDPGIACFSLVNDGADPGQTPSTAGHGFGMAGMRERMALIEGQLEADGPGPGLWRVRCTWPRRRGLGARRP